MQVWPTWQKSCRWEGSITKAAMYNDIDSTAHLSPIAGAELDLGIEEPKSAASPAISAEPMLVHVQVQPAWQTF